MSHTESRPRIEQWQQLLLWCVSGLLVFETLTGVAIYLLPFSVPNQVGVLLHTGIGLVFVIPFVWYQLQHWRAYRERQMTHVKLTGYFALVAAAVLTVSGLVLSYQAIFAERISYAWDLAHVIATVALVAAVLPHIAALVFYATRSQAEGAMELRRAQRRLGMRTVYLTVALAGVLALGSAAYHPVPMVNHLPSDYSFIYGPDRPFAPSLARTTTGQAFDAKIGRAHV